MDNSHRQAMAEAVAYEAGQLALGYFRKLDGLIVEKKGRQDLVSNADRNVEDEIRARLLRLFPGDGFLGEESGYQEPESGLGAWIVDPIDGTWCFLNGIASWCVSIAYVDGNGMPLVGVIYDPNTGELFSAAKGAGARLNGQSMSVAQASAFEDGTLSVGFSSRISADQIVPVIDQLIRLGGVYHRHGSGALALAWTAAGRLIGYVERHMNSWDCAAGLLLIEEAGGWAEDFFNNNGLHNGNPVVGGPLTMKSPLLTLTRSWFDKDR